MFHYINQRIIDIKRSDQWTNEFYTGWGLRRIVLLLIVLQSIGIRALPFQGVAASLLICVLLISRIRINEKQVFWLIALTTSFILLASRGMTTYTGLIYFTLILLTAFFYNQYINKSWSIVEFDFLKITWLLSLHGLISYLVYYFFPGSFSSLAVDGPPLRVFTIFIVNTNGINPGRATGLCWEPGLLQFVANISLFLGIKNSWPKWKLAVSFFTVIVTYSTTGIFALVPTIFYVVLLRRKSLFQWLSLFFVSAILIGFSILLFYSNIADKLGGDDTSGLIRLRDIKIGWELIKQNPLLGHGQFDQKYLLSDPKIMGIATSLFSMEFLFFSGNIGGGYTNGFLGFIASYGVLLGAFGYWFFFHNRLIQGGFMERLYFFLIFIITFFGEPITNSSLFYFLALSGFYVSKFSRLTINNNTSFINDK